MGIDPPLDATGNIIFDALKDHTTKKDYDYMIEAETSDLSGSAEVFTGEAASNNLAGQGLTKNDAKIEVTNTPASHQIDVMYDATDDTWMD